MHGPDAPQNSMEAFRRAAAAGVGIETDLRTTSDDVVVLHHDRCVRGTPVDRLSHQELNQAAGRDVPTLDDLIQARLPVMLNLDVKTPRALALALDAMLENQDRIAFVTAFQHDIAVDAAAAGLRAGYLMASAPASDAPLPPARPRLDVTVWDYDMVHLELVDRARAAGMATVVAYGPVTAGEHERLHDLGVDVAITDHPLVWRP